MNEVLIRKGIAPLAILAGLFVGCTGSDKAAAPQTRGLAQPDFEEGGAAGACADFEGELVTIELNIDTPAPRCAFVVGDQRLVLVSHFDRPVVATLGGRRFVVEAGGTFTSEQRFEEYLRPGGYLVHTDFYAGGAEIRFDPKRKAK